MLLKSNAQAFIRSSEISGPFHSAYVKEGPLSGEMERGVIVEESLYKDKKDRWQIIDHNVFVSVCVYCEFKHAAAWLCYVGSISVEASLM